ncbi:MAG: hypothetical protein FJW32_13640 [Acidobacteria bacterium]|nr:hypothetical protein [Acidobacteriota bacterium]
MPIFVGLALATLISEDLACIAAGAMVAAGTISFFEGTMACLTGIVAGDMLLFYAGRAAGRRFAKGRSFEWIEKYGGLAVVLSRFTPGMRLPTYLAAGAMAQSAARFAMWFFVAAAIWTPLLVGASARFGAQALPRGVPVWMLLGGLAAWRLRKFDWRKYRHWEFWPVWAVYAPVVPWIALLAIRYRSLRLPLLANPSIFAGGLCGESKSEILNALAPSGAVPAFRVIEAGEIIEAGKFPFVVKPDVGERGRGVRIVHKEDEIPVVEERTIVQEYVEGIELGIYYVRMPGEARGRIESITHKQFPTVTGDGVHSVAELIARDRRASLIASVYSGSERVAALGETVPLVEIGSHCRGSVFVDARERLTPYLEAEIDRIAQTMPEFHLGRFDVRIAGGAVKVLELNGLTAEPAHIYDPRVSLLDAYKALWRHWSIAFRIGAFYRWRERPLPAWRRLASLH